MPLPQKVCTRVAAVGARKGCCCPTLLVELPSAYASTSSPFASQDVVYGRTFASLPPALVWALTACGLTDPGLLRSYPQTAYQQVGLALITHEVVIHQKRSTGNGCTRLLYNRTDEQYNVNFTFYGCGGCTWWEVFTVL